MKIDGHYTYPLFTFPEIRDITDVPLPRLHYWAGHTGRPPLFASTKPTGWWNLQVPFLGLVSVLALSELRQEGIPLQKIRQAVRALSHHFGIEHALAHKRLYTDRLDLLDDDPPAVEKYLAGLCYGGNGYVERIVMDKYGDAEVIADPRYHSGTPCFVEGGVPVKYVFEQYYLGASVEKLVREYGVSKAQLESALRAAA